MPHRIMDAALGGWAIASGGLAALAQMAEGVPGISGISGGQYIGEIGAVGAILVFLWKAFSTAGRVLLDKGEKAGGRLLEFLENKDAKDREALKEFGSRVEGAVDRLGAAQQEAARETRTAIEKFSEQLNQAQQAQAASAAKTTPRRKPRQKATEA